MDLGPFLIETHLRTGRPIAELAQSHGVHRSWLYKLLKRYHLEGPAGLEARSHRPLHCPARKRDHYEDEIVTLRNELCDLGVDAGAETIRYHLQRRHEEVVVSTSTIWRVLKDRGFVIAQPQKRPQSSLKRFCAGLPNETWQAIETKKQLQAQLDRFVAYYNEVRPHRGIARQTPAEVYGAREKARPCAEPIERSDANRMRLACSPLGGR
jgi:transposase